MWIGASIAGMMILALLMQAIFAAPRPESEGQDDTDMSQLATGSLTTGQFKIPPAA
jgi:hypothetical protein